MKNLGAHHVLEVWCVAHRLELAVKDAFAKGNNLFKVWYAYNYKVLSK